MAVPRAPYCNTQDVASLLPQIVLSAPDFSPESQPTKAAVTRFVIWISAQIDQAFAALGFYVPYEEISGESWPDNQTYMLELMASFGTSGMIVGPVVKPAPSMGRDAGKSENIFTAAYNAFLASIAENAAGFRMNYRPGTKSEQITRTPRGPVTDHLIGCIDPTRFQTVDEYTTTIAAMRRMHGIDTAIQQWDHLRTVRNSLG